MRKRLLAIAAGVVGLASVATDASAAINARTDRFTAVPGSSITISFAQLLRNDTKRPPIRSLSFQGLFLDRRSRAGISSATVNADNTITIQFVAGFTGTTRFRYTITGQPASPRGREFSRGDVIFRVASPS